MSKIIQCRDLEADLAVCEGSVISNTFINEALTGWPYAIKRALEAEKEIDSLRNELNILLEQQQGRRCWD